MKIYDLQEIIENLDLDQDLETMLSDQRAAFMEVALGRYEMPLPLLLNFPATGSDCHVKACYKKGGDDFVIKVASGFYHNAAENLSVSEGVLVLCSQKNGLMHTMLHDGGFLTALRTALAAAIAAKITPWKIKTIGIVGSGSLAQQVIAVLKREFLNTTFFIWGRDKEKAAAIASNGIKVCEDIDSLINHADVIITTTPSKKPLINFLPQDRCKHLIALGSDDQDKNECAAILFEQADVVIVDNKSHATLSGETFHAIKQGYLKADKMSELGSVLMQKTPILGNMLITDLRGIAAQDLAIATFVADKLSR